MSQKKTRPYPEFRKDSRGHAPHVSLSSHMLSVATKESISQQTIKNTHLNHVARGPTSGGLSPVVGAIFALVLAILRRRLFPAFARVRVAFLVAVPFKTPTRETAGREKFGYTTARHGVVTARPTRAAYAATVLGSVKGVLAYQHWQGPPDG